MVSYFGRWLTRMKSIFGFDTGLVILHMCLSIDILIEHPLKTIKIKKKIGIVDLNPVD